MRAVQVFEAVVRCGSVTAAAEELCVSPGAISQQIHNIEKSLNVRLFERSGRSLALTSWGRLYYDRVRFAFEQLRTACELGMWQEAFRSVEDVQGVVALGKKAPRPAAMAGYYAQLTRIFAVSGAHLYNGQVTTGGGGGNGCGRGGVAWAGLA